MTLPPSETANGTTHAPACWDADVATLGGSLLQGWRWGDFKARQGWTVERVRVEAHGKLGLAQLLFRRCGPFQLAYLPRGPVVADDVQVIQALFEAIDATCARRRALALLIEPDGPLTLCGLPDSARLGRGPQPFQPQRTTKVRLADDPELLATMRSSTRAKIRRAQRDGVAVERGTSSAVSVARFYALLEETSSRNAFAIHEPDYYIDLVRTFEEDAFVAFSRVDGQDAVGLITVCQGSEAIYLYGGSSATHRHRGAAALLQYEAMRWARERGCQQYDLWGLPDADPPAGDLARGQVRHTNGDCLDGLYQFKMGFGGEIVTYPLTLERCYRPLLWRLACRFFPRYRSVSGPEADRR